MPTLGWARAYRSGDLVRFDGEGLLFQGRADDQVKLGGRRIELGEIDSALLRLPGVQGAAAAVRSTAAGNSLLVGYLQTDETFDQQRGRRPAARVPAGRPGAPAGRRGVAPDQDVRQGRPRRAALAAARRRRRRPGAQPPSRRPSSGSPTCGWRSSARTWAPARTTSSSSAEAASPRPRSSPGCAPGSPRRPSPTSTRTPRSRPWPPLWTRCRPPPPAPPAGSARPPPRPRSGSSPSPSRCAPSPGCAG